MKKLIVFIFIVIYSCNSKNSEVEKPMNSSFAEKYNDSVLISNLSSKILKNGDTLAYRELESIFMVSEHSDEFLYFSAIMSEKYHYMPAYKTNYYILKNNQDVFLKKLAIYNLLKSHEMGNTNEVGVLKKKFPNGIPNSEEFFKQP